MKSIIKSGLVLTAVLLATACGNSVKESNDELSDKKARLADLKKQYSDMGDKIAKLEEEIDRLDTSAAANQKAKLVATTSLVQQNFVHYIDLQGKVDAEDIAYVSPRNGVGGQVKEIYVTKGQYVNKGQQLLKLDDAIYQKNLEQLKTQLSFAESIFERQKNLWKDSIGTEVQYLSAKNSVESLKDQIAIAKEQISMTNIYADVSGVADQVNIKRGEFFQGMSAQGPQISIVSNNDLKVTVSIPENYLVKVKKGSAVVVEVPDVSKKFNSTISLISQVINANARSFSAEIKIPSDPNLKPNQMALVKIQDHASSNAIVIPLTTVQTDSEGKFVFVLSAEDGKKIARKKQVIIGEVYGEQIEIKSGLSSGDQLISKGFQGLYDGQAVTTEVI